MQRSSPAARLRFLDGLRGISALYIAIFHAFQIGGIVQVNDRLGTGLIDRAIKAAYYLVFSYGYCAVTIFIVLSGYSLMLPVARSSDGRLRGGAPEYFRRRARRIMPPYYAALAFSLLLFAVVPGLDRPGDVWWSPALPPFEWDALLAHVLLVHNWSEGWISRINMPMWSVAVEWQIYMLLPTVFLPIWRRFGGVPMLAAGLALGLLPQFLIGDQPFRERYIAMFVLGAFGACVGFSNDARLARLRERLPWGAISLAFLLAFLGLMMVSFRFWTRTAFAWVFIDRYAIEWVKDVIVGVATMSLMIRYARLATAEDTPAKRPPGLRVLESESAAMLGRFSYSLYLTHAPVLSVLALACLRSGLSPTAGYLTLIVLGTAISIAVAWVFYRAFERPFMAEARRPAPKPASVSPTITDRV